MTLPCGCEPDASGYGWCSECVQKLRAKIWREMPENKRRYDRQMAPEQSKEYDEALEAEHNTGCSCHINPPCSFCTKDIDNE